MDGRSVMSDAELKVNIDRKFLMRRVVHGIMVTEDTGLNYVDVFFPDGSSRTWGYIGRNAKQGDVFAPMAKCPQAICDMVQRAINRKLGSSDDQAPPPVMLSYDDDVLDGDDDE